MNIEELHQKVSRNKFNEFNRIWKCDCGSTDYSDYGGVRHFFVRVCDSCGEEGVINLLAFVEDEEWKKEWLEKQL